MGWTEKTLEIASTKFKVGDDGTIRIEFGVQETAESVYDELAATEEQSVLAVPLVLDSVSTLPAPPTSFSVTSSAATALIGADNVLHPRALMQWSTPQDSLVKLIQAQYALVVGGTPGPWISISNIDAGLNAAYVSDLVAGQEYNFRIRSIRPATGATSVWVNDFGFTVTTTLSVLSNLGVGIGSLFAEADGLDADIICNPFPVKIGNLVANVLSGGAVTLFGLTQRQLWHVYYDDPTFARGRSDYSRGYAKPGRL